MVKQTLNALMLAGAVTIAAGPLLAQSQGDWTFGVGVGNVNPKSDNGDLAGGKATIDSDSQPVFTIEYFVRDNLGVELLLATPFEHDISIAGIGDAGSTKHLPPTLSLNYHFPTGGPLTPYLGAGINYTSFFQEDSGLGKLELDDSFGFALQAGVDYQLSATSALRFTARWIDIDSDVKLNGAKIGTAEIDPVVLSASYVFQF